MIAIGIALVLVLFIGLSDIEDELRSIRDELRRHNEREDGK